MTTLRMNDNPRLANYLYRDAGAREAVLLIDVGCSGGVEHHWLRFGSALRVIGFDPLIAEIERLRATAPEGTRYEAAFVGSAEIDQAFPPLLRGSDTASRNNASVHRTSAAKFARLTNLNYDQEVFNRGAPLEFTTRKIDLDEFAAAEGIRQIDFLKVDTDGHDIEVLIGAQRLLNSTCLAASVEVQFHGACHPRANTFANIDTLMRDAGFTLFDLEPFRYTRAALPGQFLYDIPAQTTGGAVQWGEALYARDFADPRYGAKHGLYPSAEDLLKLASFFDIFGLQDCAAELLLARRDLLDGKFDMTNLLDALTPVDGAGGHDYEAYIAAFHRRPDGLFPSRISERPRRARRRGLWPISIFGKMGWN